jgi:hypothetical protein
VRGLPSREKREARSEKRESRIEMGKEKWGGQGG